MDETRASVQQWCWLARRRPDQTRRAPTLAPHLAISLPTIPLHIINTECHNHNHYVYMQHHYLVSCSLAVVQWHRSAAGRRWRIRAHAVASCRARRSANCLVSIHCRSARHAVCSRGSPPSWSDAICLLPMPTPLPTHTHIHVNIIICQYWRCTDLVFGELWRVAGRLRRHEAAVRCTVAVGRVVVGRTLSPHATGSICHNLGCQRLVQFKCYNE